MEKLIQRKGLDSISRFKKHLCELSRKELSDLDDKIKEVDKLHQELSGEISALQACHLSIVNSDEGLDVGLLNDCLTVLNQYKLEQEEVSRQRETLRNQRHEIEQELIENQQSLKITEKLIEKNIQKDLQHKAKREIKSLDEMMVLRFESL